MDPIRREKRSIQRREQWAHTAFSLLLLIGFLAFASLMTFLTRSGVFFSSALLSTCGFPLFSIVLFFIIIGLCIRLLGPYMQETRRRKQHWLNEYGRHIDATLSLQMEENTVFINESVSGRHASYRRYLYWQDPQTAQRYAFCVSARFSPTLSKLSEGALCPVQFDPDDLAFFEIPGK